MTNCSFNGTGARRKTSPEIWEQVKVAYASGVGLREIARKMQIPAGTVLARAKREGWILDGELKCEFDSRRERFVSR